MSSEVLDCFSLAVKRLPLTPPLASLVFLLSSAIWTWTLTLCLRPESFPPAGVHFQLGGGEHKNIQWHVYIVGYFSDKFYTQTQKTLRFAKRYVEGESEHQTLNKQAGESAERANTKHTYSAAMSVMLAHLTDLQMSSVS